MLPGALGEPWPGGHRAREAAQPSSGGTWAESQVGRLAGDGHRGPRALALLPWQAQFRWGLGDAGHQALVPRAGEQMGDWGSGGSGWATPCNPPEGPRTPGPRVWRVRTGSRIGCGAQKPIPAEASAPAPTLRPSLPQPVPRPPRPAFSNAVPTATAGTNRGTGRRPGRAGGPGLEGGARGGAHLPGNHGVGSLLLSPSKPRAAPRSPPKVMGVLSRRTPALGKGARRVRLRLKASGSKI